MRKPLIFILILLLAGGLVAQEETPEPAPIDNGQWERIFGGPVSVAYPPTWQIGADASGELVIEDPMSGASFTFTINALDRAYTVEEIAEEFDPDPATLVSEEIVELPGGPAYRLEESITQGEATLRLIQYAFPYDETLIFFQGAVLEQDMDADLLTTVVSTIDAAANTLRIDDRAAMPWPRVTNADQTVEIRLPKGWELLDSQPATVTVRQPDDFAIVVVTAIELDEPLPLAAFQPSFEQSLEDRGAEIFGSAEINRPAGDMLWAHAEVLVDVGEEEPAPWQEYQYNLVRGNRLIIITTTVRSELFEEYAPVFWRIVDSLTLPDQTG